MTSLSDAEETEEKITIPELGGTLRPFQEAAVAYALNARQCFLAEEMGLGKTVEALATLKAADAFPAVVVCPASLKYNWLRETQKWLPGVKAVVLNGKTPARSEVAGFDVVILNYDILGKWLEILKALHPKAVVLDESHYIKNHKAKRTEAAQELCKGAEYRIFLTGTPILNRPQELLSQLSAMGKLNDLGGFWHFAKRYCQAFKGRWGWDFSGSAHLDELNVKMRATCYVRHEKKDVLTELPEKTRTTIPIEIDNRAEYEEAEADVIEYAGYLAAQDKAFQNSIKHLDKKERQEAVTRRMQDASYKAQKAEQLVKIEVLKQVTAKGKMAAIKDWIESFVDSGEKLVVFGWHKTVVDAIADLCKCKQITGDTSAEARQKAVDEFQNDPEVKVIACNIQAGGVGLTLTAASNVAFLEFGWNPGTMDQAEDRVHRIGQTYPVNIWNLAGINTIDEDIIGLIESKRSVVNATTNGTSGSDVSSLINSLKKKHTE